MNIVCKELDFASNLESEFEQLLYDDKCYTKERIDKIHFEFLMLCYYLSDPCLKERDLLSFGLHPDQAAKFIFWYNEKIVQIIIDAVKEYKLYIQENRSYLTKSDKTFDLIRDGVDALMNNGNGSPELDKALDDIIDDSKITFSEKTVNAERIEITEMMTPIVSLIVKISNDFPITIDAKSKAQFSQPQVALMHYYLYLNGEGPSINDANKDEIAKKFGNESGAKLKSFYEQIKINENRINLTDATTSNNNKIKNFEAVISYFKEKRNLLSLKSIEADYKAFRYKL